MTEEQKKKIRRMRLDGFGYKHIATTLVLPLSTVKGYCKRNGLIGIGPVVAMNNEVSVQLGLICKNCGKRLKHTAGKKKKTFCSDKCRKEHWRLNNEVKSDDRTY
ncbi:MAG: RNA polymerase subunit sigma-70 [Clostridia bacterium]